jgi:ribosomal protein S18 acetylase RimI-like enzyme
VDYQLAPASASDATWLEQLRRSVYQELFAATFGGWDEARHTRHVNECWKRGGISLIEIDKLRVGMIQLFESPDAIEIGEIQIQPPHQNHGLGTRVLKDIITRAHRQGKKVLLSVGLKNERAYRLYVRLGFTDVGRTLTHSMLALGPT